MLTWNVRGLKRKLSDTDFTEYVKQYDIVILGETWIHKNDFTNFDMEGYYCDHVFASRSLDTTKWMYRGWNFRIRHKQVKKTM